MSFLKLQSMAVKFNKHFSCFATCHVVGIVNFYIYYHNIYLSVPSPHQMLSCAFISESFSEKLHINVVNIKY